MIGVHSAPSVESKLVELGRVNSGLKRFMQRRRNAEHNEEVGKMEQLVGNLQQLRTRGLFYPDNFVAGAAYLGGIMAPLAYSLRFIAVGKPDPAFVNMAAISTTAVAAIMGGLFGQLLMRELPLPIDRARYIDRKLSSFYGISSQIPSIS